MGLDQERIRGQDAKQLLQNPVLKEAFESTERQILEQMKQVKPSDERMHTRLIDAYKLLHTIRGHIEKRIQTGQLAELQLEKESTLGRVVRKFSRI